MTFCRSVARQYPSQVSSAAWLPSSCQNRQSLGIFIVRSAAFDKGGNNRAVPAAKVGISFGSHGQCRKESHRNKHPFLKRILSSLSGVMVPRKFKQFLRYTAGSANGAQTYHHFIGLCASQASISSVQHGWSQCLSGGGRNGFKCANLFEPSNCSVFVRMPAI